MKKQKCKHPGETPFMPTSAEQHVCPVCGKIYYCEDALWDHTVINNPPGVEKKNIENGGPSNV